MSTAVIHPSADVSPNATIGNGTRVWHGVQVREDAAIGDECIIGKNVYIDFGVQIGNRCKIQNNVSIFHGATLEDGVFVGPHACITNDRLPRAITPNGELKQSDDWEVGPVLLRYGSSLGAGAIVLPGVTVGKFALVGSGAVVTRDVPDHGLAVGNPARLIGFVCACGGRLAFESPLHDARAAEANSVWSTLQGHGSAHGRCTRCDMTTMLSFEVSTEGADAHA
jgi:UDP-2-acetamido-3-amino-2,3-dideoxy-glucuronate N-acetyltransferase